MTENEIKETKEWFENFLETYALSNQETREFQKAVACLEEAQQYHAIGTVEELQALKEKAEPKKPIIVHKQTCQLGTEVEWKCPVCGRNCIELAPCQKYCADCGTKFDWS